MPQRNRWKVNTQPRRNRPRIELAPTLRFTPYAWAKFLFMRDQGPTEIGGFGLTVEDSPLLVEDILLVRQSCTSVSVCFEDAAVADLFEDQVARGIAPARFARIWLHTHPGDCAAPSGTDERTFTRGFGRCDWAVMGILACGGETYARLRLGQSPVVEVSPPMEVDFSFPFPATDHSAWQAEYARCVQTQVEVKPQTLHFDLPNYFPECIDDESF